MCGSTVSAVAAKNAALALTALADAAAAAAAAATATFLASLSLLERFRRTPPVGSFAVTLRDAAEKEGGCDGKVVGEAGS